ncbi:MAG: NAD(P)H-dependent oxidoreductase [Clostridia bacterium]|nr:NAD(P)H-dependent oxidoreductase [Clostridia bacterium]
MKHLIVYSHPNPASFNNAIKETILEVSKEKGHETVVRDLYSLKFDAVLKGQDFEDFGSGRIPEDIKTEQEHIRWADLITFVYPVWWAGMPAILKGYIDRVFSTGFAYAYGQNGIEKLLTGKKAVIFNTGGTAKDIYQNAGMLDTMHKILAQGIFEFCGIEVVSYQYFGAVPLVDDSTRKGMLAEVKTIMSNIL